MDVLALILAIGAFISCLACIVATIRYRLRHKKAMADLIEARSRAWRREKEAEARERELSATIEEWQVEYERIRSINQAHTPQEEKQ